VVAVMSPDEPKAPDTLKEEAAQSLKKAHDLVEELKSVQEYELTVLGDDEPPLFVTDE
jgi:phage terminase small subunit